MKNPLFVAATWIGLAIASSPFASAGSVIAPGAKL